MSGMKSRFPQFMPIYQTRAYGAWTDVSYSHNNDERLVKWQPRQVEMTLSIVIL